MGVNDFIRKKNNIPILILTPTPDLRHDLRNDQDELSKLASQIRELASKFKVGLIDSYMLFETIQKEFSCVQDYMAEVNHINEKGHLVVAKEILSWFIE